MKVDYFLGKTIHTFSKTSQAGNTPVEVQVTHSKPDHVAFRAAIPSGWIHRLLPGDVVVPGHADLLALKRQELLNIAAIQMLSLQLQSN